MTKNAGSNNHHFKRALRLFNVEKYVFFITLLVIYLPFSSIDGYLLNSSIGGLFHELSTSHLFFATASYLAAVWALMFCACLLMDIRRKRISQAHDGNNGTGSDSADSLNSGLASRLRIPVPFPTFIVFTLLAVHSIWFSVELHSGNNTIALAIVALGGLFAFACMILVSLPAAMADQNFKPIADQRIEWLLQKLRRRPFIKPFISLKTFASFIFIEKLNFKSLGGHAPGEESTIDSRHFFATTNVIGVSFIFLFIAFVFYPFHPHDSTIRNFASSLPSPPALAYLYMLLFFLIWFTSFLDFLVSRIRLPLIVFGIVWLLAIYRYTDYDYPFAVFEPVPLSQENNQAHLTVDDIIKASENKENFIVITATGGGIWAAGWITTSISNLVYQGMDFSEVRALSTVSGGSVGAAQLLAAKRNTASVLPQTHYLDDAVKNSVSHSLRSVIYGITCFDFWRNTIGKGAFWASDRDRGIMIERRFAQIANPKNTNASQPSLRSLNSDIRSGSIPLPILNATVMETGRRVMATPLEFSKPLPEEENPIKLPGEMDRAQTLFELLTTPNPNVSDGENKSLTSSEKLDIGLWSAARLSASFSYVSPAAQAKFTPPSSPSSVRKFHIIDGGYYDNYGVASALDFLEAIFTRLDPNKLPFKRVLLIQLRSSPILNPADQPSSDSFSAQLLGPIQGVLNIRDGAAFSRNELELRRFIERWNDHFKSKSDDEKAPPIVSTMVFDYPEYEDFTPPLSWHLTQEQKNALNRPWIEANDPNSKPDNAFRKNLQAIKELSEVRQNPGPRTSN